jgi:hypothetical protein
VARHGPEVAPSTALFLHAFLESAEKFESGRQSDEVTRLPSVLTPHDLPLAELSALHLDGELVAVDDAFAPLDQPPSPTQRAASLALLCEQRLIAERRTAAWIWGASLDAPPRHDLCVSIGARAGASHSGRLHVREVVIAPEEMVALGGVHVTTPMRTVMDLARASDAFDPGLVTTLLEVSQLSLDECIAELRSRRNLPQKRLALKRLDTLGSSQN